MISNLEGKIQAPIIVFDEDIVWFNGIYFTKEMDHREGGDIQINEINFVIRPRKGDTTGYFNTGYYLDDKDIEQLNRVFGYPKKDKLVNEDVVGYNRHLLNFHPGRDLINFDASLIENIYNSKCEQKQGIELLKPVRPFVELPGHLRGMQVFLNDNVVYEASTRNGHHFSILDEGNYVGHRHGYTNDENFAMDLSLERVKDEYVKAILDKTGKIVWHNPHIR